MKYKKINKCCDSTCVSGRNYSTRYKNTCNNVCNSNCNDSCNSNCNNACNNICCDNCNNTCNCNKPCNDNCNNNCGKPCNDNCNNSGNNCNKPCSDNCNNSSNKPCNCGNVCQSCGCNNVGSGNNVCQSCGCNSVCSSCGSCNGDCNKPPKPPRPPFRTELASLLNTGGQTIDDSGIVSLNQVVSISNMVYDAAASILTLGVSNYYKITYGVTVESFTGNPVVEVIANGLNTGILMPINSIGNATLSFIESYPIGTTIQLAVRNGSITLSSVGNNAFLEVVGFDTINNLAL